MLQLNKSFSSQRRKGFVHPTIIGYLATFTILLATLLIGGIIYASEKHDVVELSVTEEVTEDYFFPLLGFPECDIKSSEVYRTSFNGISAIGYKEYLGGQLYLNGYELLPDPDSSPAELYTQLTSQFRDSYGEPAVKSEQKAYPEPDNRLQIWFNEESSTRVFLNLAGKSNQKRCYIAFVDYN
jgi:hypothetical protein